MPAATDYNPQNIEDDIAYREKAREQREEAREETKLEEDDVKNNTVADDDAKKDELTTRTSKDTPKKGQIKEADKEAKKNIEKTKSTATEKSKGLNNDETPKLKPKSTKPSNDQKPPKKTGETEASGQKLKTESKGPQKAETKPPKATAKDTQQEANKSEEIKDNSKTTKAKLPGNNRKRKAESSISSASSSSTKRTRGAAARADLKPISVIKFLLSDEGAALARTEEEDGKKLGYDSHDLTPFQTLICIMMIARPINHRLQSRAIVTLFNEPYSFTTPEKLANAKDDDVWQALNEAKTQHKVKTAQSLVAMGKVVVEKYSKKEGDGSLEKLREEAEHDADEECELLVDAVKGFGKTGANLLARRLQQSWPEMYPTADDRALTACKEFGLPAKNAEELAAFVKDNLSEVGGGERDDDARKTFVKVLERAVRLHIENKMDEARKAMSAMNN